MRGRKPTWLKSLGDTFRGIAEVKANTIIVDEETFNRISSEIENPRPPNQALIDLLKNTKVAKPPNWVHCVSCEDEHPIQKRRGFIRMGSVSQCPECGEETHTFPKES